MMNISLVSPVLIAYRALLDRRVERADSLVIQLGNISTALDQELCGVYTVASKGVDACALFQQDLQNLGLALEGYFRVGKVGDSGRAKGHICRYIVGCPRA
jgi:hypothetical protein